MAQVISLAGRTSKSGGKPNNTNGCQILMFTGVRYERLVATPSIQPLSQPRSSKVKRPKA
ncbi:hypothetical protein [Oryzifoliimicrobium ureilyticus]|uniref:hypothetical protein n=1 Tax=Oryzifoliimicrobium ureilyticus TaxID=3113724 RepID=UPI00307608F1